MGDDGYKGIKDANWEQVNSDLGEIKFRKRNSARKAKKLVKALSFFLVASFSGGLSGFYVAKGIYADEFTHSNTSLFQPNTNSYRTVDMQKSTFTKVAETIGPAVVGISIKFEGSLGEKDSANASGMIFDSKGYIVTNYHVIQGADKITVKLSNGKVFLAKYVGSEPKSDLAVIKIDADNLPIVSFGDSSKVKVGDIAIAIGNPLGEEFAGTVTSGIISAVNRKIQNGGKTYKILQTDAVISLGNSGGALCNEIGEVVGINNVNLISNDIDNIQGLGFAISINEANEVIKTIMSTVLPAKDRPKENVDIKTIMGIKAVDAVIGANNDIKGAYVKEVVIGSEAAIAGIHPTDIIVQIDEMKILGFKDFENVIKSHKSKDSIKYKIYRNGQFVEITLVLS